MLSKAKWMRYQEPIKISLCDGCAHSRYRGKASVQYSPRFSTSSTAVRRSPFPSEGKAYGNSAYPPSRGRLKKVLHLRKSARNFVAGASLPLTREVDFCAAKRRRERNILRAFGLVIILSLPQSRWRSTAPSSEGAGWATSLDKEIESNKKSAAPQKGRRMEIYSVVASVLPMVSGVSSVY